MGMVVIATKSSSEIIKDEIDPVVIRTVHGTQILMANLMLD